MVRFVAWLPSSRNGDEEAGRRPVREPGMAARVEPQPPDGGRNGLRARRGLYPPEGRSLSVAAQEPSAAQPVERQLHYRACEQGRPRELATADRKQLARVGAGPERSRAVDDHARDRTLPREPDHHDGGI